MVMLIIGVKEALLLHAACMLAYNRNEQCSYNFVLPSNHSSLRFHFIFLFFFLFLLFIFFKGPVEFFMFWRLSLQTYQHLIGSIIIKLKKKTTSGHSTLMDLIKYCCIWNELQVTIIGKIGLLCIYIINSQTSLFCHQYMHY